ncbi:Uncharacterised protein [Actinobacillus equuli]|nr:Uncharacterised protein [Actinobacillus equuli]
MPVEQIRAMILNRMMDHNIYAYYSGVLYAADLQGNFNHLDPECWNLVQTPSMSQGIHDAMLDIQKAKYVVMNISITVLNRFSTFA